MKALSDSERAAVLRIVAEHQSRPGPLIEILHAVQAGLGFVPAAAVPVIAQGLNLSRAEVHGVVTFYHFFRDKPAGRHIVRLCQAESCKAMGGEALAQHAKQRLGVDFHETTADGNFTLEPVYCLGNCACSPALMIDDDDLRGRVTPQAFDDIVTLMGRPT
jgi:formate dehydrogenase subunit gamma